jgi:hypothetical protein
VRGQKEFLAGFVLPISKTFIRRYFEIGDRHGSQIDLKLDESTGKFSFYAAQPLKRLRHARDFSILPGPVAIADYRKDRDCCRPSPGEHLRQRAEAVHESTTRRRYHCLLLELLTRIHWTAVTIKVHGDLLKGISGQIKVRLLRRLRHQWLESPDKFGPRRLVATLKAGEG